MNISGIYALTNQTTTGIFSTGIVDIQLQTYKLNKENQEVKYEEENKLVMPGEIISFIPKVCNLGAECYVRAKADFIDSNNVSYNDTLEFLGNWKKYGEFYYYNGILDIDGTIKLFDSIQISEDLLQQNENTTLKLEIVVQAVQSKNFKPDYSLPDPWNGIEPEKSINSSYDIVNNSKITIKYENDTHKSIIVPNNFLEKMNSAMPGDSFSENIEIKNNSPSDAKYYLQIKINGNTENENELLSYVDLIITNNNGKNLYSGKLLSTGKIELGKFSPNEYDNLEFKILVPSELGNEYALLNPEISFIYSADFFENGGEREENSKNEDSQNSSIVSDNSTIINNQETSNKEDSSSNPKTGDSIDWSIIIFFISTLCLITVMLYGYKLKKKEEYL